MPVSGIFGTVQVGDDAAAVLAVRGEHAVVSGEMGAGAWDEGREAGNEVDGVEHDMGGAVPEGVLESIHDLGAVIDREAFVGDGGAGDVAAQAFEGVAFMGFAHGAGMDGEATVSAPHHSDTDALWQRISTLSAAILRTSASLDMATELQEAADSARALTLTSPRRKGGDDVTTKSYPAPCAH